MQTHRTLATSSVIVGAILLGIASCATGSSSGGAGGEGGDSSGSGPTAGPAGPGSTSIGSSVSGTGGATVGSGGAATTGTLAASVSSTGTGVGPINVGITCTSDAECGAGGKCISGSTNDPLLSGGAASGYCTKSCTTNADCVSLNSTCITDMNGNNGECFLNCTLGPPLQYLNDMLDPNKCRGREDVRCDDSVLMGASVCMPTCGSNVECPAGRSCDPKYSVCVTSPSQGQPMGSSCTGGCAGNCYNITGGAMMCSSMCVLAGEIDLNDCGGLTKGLCAFSTTGNGVGDVGVCTEACSVQTDCLNPYLWCRRVGGVTGSIVSNGWCFSAVPCPNGQTDCASVPNTTCTNKGGTSYCIDTMFP